ncbi:hypothetical protein EU642_22310 [Salmonella enterica]|nr:hypothetical protein [Salmonella enterica]EAO0118588.1 hypothetical protein [Salmonella enterica]EAO3601691.1 hypothetical protein [Salmonella enterica]EAR6391586.1 hypothetical protein [Salmonella enterica]EAV1285350.1 hypothetical protein [Salmonella enterica]
MNVIEIYGDPGDFSGSYDDDGQHMGHQLAPCPFCGRDDELAICNTHTPLFWVECESCEAEKRGEYDPFVTVSKTEEEARKGFERVLKTAVDAWNTRAND